MKKLFTKIVGVSLSVLLIASALSGCAGGKDGADKNLNTKNTAAMGRYLEEEVKPPEGTKAILSMVKQTEGGIRIAVSDMKNKNSIWDSKDGGTTWTKAFDLPKEVEKVSLFNANIAIAPTGEIAVVTEETGTEQSPLSYRYWTVGNDGKAQEFKLQLPEMPEFQMEGGASAAGSQSVVIDDAAAKETGESEKLSETTESDKEVNLEGSISNGIGRMRFTKDGKLLAQDYMGVLYMIDIKTGELIYTFGGDDSNTNGAGYSGYIMGFQAVGNTLIVLTDSEVQLYDISTGKKMDKDKALNDQLIKSSNTGEDGAIIMGASGPFAADSGKDENSIFICNSDGMYSHAIGGNLVEQVINGALNSLGNPSFYLMDMAALDDGTFLVSGAEGQNIHKLYRYKYSKDAPATPSTEIKLYSINDCPELRQAIAIFQKQNPDMCVTLEVGVSGGDAVTVSDALRTLNTNILAGKGPDIMVLDGMPINSYMEKGLLADLSETLKNAGVDTQIFENIKKPYEKDKKIMALPIRFAIPLVQGKKEFVDDITNLDTFAAQVEKLKKENPSQKYILGEKDPKELVDLFYPESSPSWIKEDGTLEQAKLTEFYTSLKKLYDSEEHVDNGGVETMMVASASGGLSFSNYLNMSMGMWPLIDESAFLNAGILTSGFEFAYMNGVNKGLGDYTSKIMNGQSENVFIPITTMGISSKSANPEAASKFIGYLFSKEGQTINQGSGLPVNKEAFDVEMDLNDELVEDNVLSFKQKSGKEISVKIDRPNESELKVVKDWIGSLNTAALTDDVIKAAVEEQAQQCLTGEITAEQAAKSVIQKVNLYLSE